MGIGFLVVDERLGRALRPISQGFRPVIFSHTSPRELLRTMANVVTVFVSVESGFPDGLAVSLWGDSPLRLHLSVRFVIYGYFLNKYGLIHATYA